MLSSARPHEQFIICMPIYVYSQPQPPFLFTDSLSNLQYAFAYARAFSLVIFIHGNCLYNAHIPFCPGSFRDHITNTCFSRASANTLWSLRSFPLC